MQIKSFLVKFLAKSFRFMTASGRWIFNRTRFIGRGVKFLFNGLFKGAIFHIYRTVFVLKYRILKVYAPAKSKVFYVLNKSYLVHLIIILMGIVVVFNNISASELREDNFGEKTIIYAVVTKEPMEELTEETQVYESTDQVLSYLDKSAMIGNTLLGGVIQNDSSMASEFSTVIEGGSAVIKPNIIEAVHVEDLPEVNKPSRANITTYTVQPGETISAIAENFGVKVETILWQNDLSERSLIRPGDTLEILPINGVAHKVASGETISAIAKKYGVESDKIISYNNLFDVNDIQIGQKLIIPDGKKIVPYISTPSYASSTPTVSPISKLFIPPAQAVTTGGMLWPAAVRRISQYFSWTHTGLDIAGPTGTAIYASEAGTVIYAGWSTGYGNNILLDNGGGLKTRYAHSSKLYVAVGDHVVKGQTIMAMGSTGWSTGPHLHFEVIINGAKKNPLSYIK